jgi:Fe2+ transport system protein FeoA
MQLMGTAADAMSDLKAGERGRIEGFELPPDLRQRLLEMGLTIGAEFEIIRFAPLGDPVEIKVRGYHLSIRKREASGIRVARL